MSDATYLALVRTPRPSLRLALAAALLLGAAAGYLATPAPLAAQAVAEAGAELTRLLRLMTLLKVMMLAGALWLVDWRLRFPIRAPLALGYVGGVAAMAAGPGLIWSMAHVALGAALLHGGFALLLVLFWRDPGSPAMLPRRPLGR